MATLGGDREGGPAVAFAVRRLQDEGHRLRAALEPVLLAAGGAHMRVTSFAKTLGIDYTLASRFVRALRSPDPLELLHRLPAPVGLRMVLEAAAALELDAAQLGAAADAVARFQSLIDESPSGRAGLDAALSADVPAARARNEQAARQSVYKSMSFLLGYQCESVHSTYILQPSSNPIHVDSILVQERAGLRRLRQSMPITIAGSRRFGEPAGSGDVRFETIEGALNPDDPSDYLLPAFCSDQLPELEIARSSDYVALAFPENAPPLNTPVTLTHAVVSRNDMLRHRSPTRDEEWAVGVHRTPCKSLVLEVLVREDTYPGITPEFSLRLPSVGGMTSRERGRLGDLDRLDLSTRIEEVKPWARTAEHGSAGAARADERLEHVFDVTGWERERFRRYRCLMAYPLPNIVSGWWFPLPPAP